MRRWLKLLSVLSLAVLLGGCATAGDYPESGSMASSNSRYQIPLNDREYSLTSPHLGIAPNGDVKSPYPPYYRPYGGGKF